MYSAVLMLALTAGSETADFGRNRCSCTTSCTTTVVTSCSKAASCSSSCHARTKLFGNRCHGCTTSCTTTVVVAAPVCSTSCSSSCHARKKLFGHRCSSSCTVVYGCSTTVVVPATKTMPKSETVPAPKKGAVSLSVPATIVVSLPAGANLIVDGTPTTSTAERRTFVTPELEVGVTYVYSMRAELVRDGRTVVESQDVTVRGGETSTVQFQFSNQGVASR
jgi:uncharacterized protein (TIGR03000 family)